MTMMRGKASIPLKRSCCLLFACAALSAAAGSSCIISGDIAREPAEMSGSSTPAGGFSSMAYELESQVFDVFRFGPRIGFGFILR